MLQRFFRTHSWGTTLDRNERTVRLSEPTPNGANNVVQSVPSFSTPYQVPGIYYERSVGSDSIAIIFARKKKSYKNYTRYIYTSYCILSSGGLVKIKLKLTTLPRFFFFVVSRIRSTQSLGYVYSCIHQVLRSMCTRVWGRSAGGKKRASGCFPLEYECTSQKTLVKYFAPSGKKM